MIRNKWMLLLSSLILTACANNRMSTTTIPNGVSLGKEVKIPNDTTIAVYLPPSQTALRVYAERLGFWLEPGKQMSEAVEAVMKTYFPNHFNLDNANGKKFGLLFDFHPEWKLTPGNVEVQMSYKVFGKDHSVLLEGMKSFSTDVGDLSHGTGFYNASLKSTQLAVIDALKKLTPDATKNPALSDAGDMPAKALVKMDKPIKTGTGFYINESGQILTAAHVLSSCPLVQVQTNGKTLVAEPVAHSALLDLEVINTGTPVSRHLSFRKSLNFELGEAVTNVGYPLQGLLAASPNLTRGNISSKTALTGSLGLFQFSAPIQPGSSGGPVVSDGGELLGITVSTLNAAKLIQEGILPQNVNFALDAKYAEKFLEHNHVKFTLIDKPASTSMQVANEAALSSVVQLACYE